MFTYFIKKYFKKTYKSVKIKNIYNCDSFFFQSTYHHLKLEINEITIFICLIYKYHIFIININANFIIHNN